MGLNRGKQVTCRVAVIAASKEWKTTLFALTVLVVGVDCKSAPTTRESVATAEQRRTAAPVSPDSPTDVERGQTEARPAPAGPAQPEPTSMGRYDLGALPEAFGEVRWPAAPRIRREVEIERGERVIDRPGTRVIVRGALERIVVQADDVEIRGEEGARIDHVVIGRGRARIRILGGRYGKIELSVPAQFVPPPVVWRREWMARDVSIDGVEVDAADSAFMIRGKRVAILRSQVRAAHYSIWCGDTDEFQSEDLIIAGNRFASAGPESTVRLVSVRRAVVVDNVISNTSKHDFRVHGVSDGVLFARNRLLNTGIMVGSMEDDRIGGVWILDNAMYHRAPSLFEVEPARVRGLVVSGNRVFSDRWSCLVCDRTGVEWMVDRNSMAPYQEPED